MYAVSTGKIRVCGSGTWCRSPSSLRSQQNLEWFQLVVIVTAFFRDQIFFFFFGHYTISIQRFVGKCFLLLGRSTVNLFPETLITRNLVVSCESRPLKVNTEILDG
jgi:hypothetical protein